MLTYAPGNWWTLKDEIEPLWERHWQEIAGDKDRIPLDPDWNAYDGIAASGRLFIQTARDGEKLVGYLFAFVTPHMHYRSTLCAFYDLFWLAPEYRKGWAGYRLLKSAEEVLKAMGVVKAFGQTKVWHDVGPLFERMGWRETEILYSKLL